MNNFHVGDKVKVIDFYDYEDSIFHDLENEYDEELVSNHFKQTGKVVGINNELETATIRFDDDKYITFPYDCLEKVSRELKKYDRVLYRNDNLEAWEIGLFNQMGVLGKNKNKYQIYKNKTLQKYCIPYDGNEELLGTIYSSLEEKEKMAIKPGDQVYFKKEMYDFQQYNDRSKVINIVQKMEECTTPNQIFGKVCTVFTVEIGSDKFFQTVCREWDLIKIQI